MFEFAILLIYCNNIKNCLYLKKKQKKKNKKKNGLYLKKPKKTTTQYIMEGIMLLMQTNFANKVLFIMKS